MTALQVQKHGDKHQIIEIEMGIVLILFVRSLIYLKSPSYILQRYVKLYVEI
jgi:hypothetical protein